MINGYETTESQSMNLIEKLDEFDKKYVKIMNQTKNNVGRESFISI